MNCNNGASENLFLKFATYIVIFAKIHYCSRTLYKRDVNRAIKTQAALYQHKCTNVKI